jgi:dihydroorotase
LSCNELLSNYVKPNLIPPISTVAAAVKYREELKALDPSIEYLMTLYLNPSLTVSDIAAAAKAGISGVKSYPKGVTTNSDSGVISYEQYYPLFEAMQEHDLVLNLHGEVPSSANDPSITVLSAEAAFLPTLISLHKRFPKLRIVLEHCTTEAAVNAVLSCGPTVAATLTAHHLYITIDDWAADAYSFCKPVAKLPSDRDALIGAALSGNPKFFFGTDSAPHPRSSKTVGKGVAAGVFTQPYALQYVAQVFSTHGQFEKLRNFVTDFGRSFYKLPPATHDELELYPAETVIVDAIGEGDDAIVPFRAGQKLSYGVRWLT